MKAFSDQGLVECLYSACDEGEGYWWLWRFAILFTLLVRLHHLTSRRGQTGLFCASCAAAGYTCAVEDWQRSKFESSYTGDANDSVKFVSRGAEEATALGRWAAVLEGAEVVSLLH